MKQFLLMCNENMINILGAALPSIHFIEVQGMTMAGNDAMNVLVSPIVPPTPPVASESPKMIKGDSKPSKKKKSKKKA